MRSCALAFILSFVIILQETAQSPRNDLNNLNGKHLFAGAGQYGPFLEIKWNASGSVTYRSGSMMELFDWLSKRLNFTYTLVPSSENYVGVFVNGSWRGLIGQLLRKEINISIGPTAPTWDRAQVVNFAGLSGGTESSLVVKYPDARLSNYAIIEPFDLSIWLCWIMSFWAICAAGVWSIYCVLGHFDQTQRYNSATQLIMYILGIITAQGSYYQTKTYSLRMVASVWCLAAAIFVNVYCSVLISYLSTQYKLPEVNSLADLAESDFHIGTIQGTISEFDIMTSKLPHHKTLAERLEKCQRCPTSSKLDGVANLIVNEKFVFFMPKQATRIVIKKDIKDTGHCRLTLAREKYNWHHLYFAVQKSSPYSEQLNRESLWAHAMGLVKKWTADDYSPIRCQLKYSSRGASVQKLNNPLTLPQFYVAFVIFVAGCLLATLRFLWEVLLLPRTCCTVKVVRKNVRKNRSPNNCEN